MQTLSFDHYGQSASDDQARWRKLAPMAAIVAGHALMFYLFHTGMLRQVAHAVLPNVVTINFVAAAEPVKPAAPPVPPSTPVPVAQVTVPPLPPVAIAASEPTISVAPTPARSAEAPASSASVAVAAVASTPVAAPKTVSSVEYLRAPQAIYPHSSRRLGETGVVMLRVLIGEKGQAEQVVVQKSSGYANLDEAGRQAVMRALYKPYVEDGKAIAVYALVPINFQLG
ncbi:energy transducer TonB [Duganella qianjiadongensis]|uniref:TonB family protein n=1 Tax=Duganella qianjiadongensis TaxID=2692176 RepID=A0ABW9VLJ0_9BURK|nr:energy transducer TonB [Duganella qianjiadongensis]MYM40468.1 TonB family protein [Duganella qianjiadongensis]